MNADERTVAVMRNRSRLDARIRRLTCTNHDLVNVLRDLSEFAVSTEAQLPSERIEYGKAWGRALAALANAQRAAKKEPLL